MNFIFIFFKFLYENIGKTINFYHTYFRFRIDTIDRISVRSVQKLSRKLNPWQTMWKDTNEKRIRKSGFSAKNVANALLRVAR